MIPLMKNAFLREAETKAALAEFIRAADKLSMGEQCRRFEEAFATYQGRRHAVLVNSGSSANLLMLQSLKSLGRLKPGDKVGFSALTWSTNVMPIIQMGFEPVPVDCEMETLNVSPKTLRERLDKETVGAFFITNALGFAGDISEIRRICAERSIILIEDNCESMDAELAGRKTGSFGHLNTFSTFFSHHISTMEGGIVLTDDVELYHLCRAIRAHGWTRDLPADTKLFERGTDEHFEAYRFIVPGYNVRPLELSGAIGREQLKKLPDFTEIRRRNMALFHSLFGGDERFIIQREHGKSSSFSFTVILNPERGEDRDKVFSALREADIGFRIITGGCFLRHDTIRYYDYDTVGDIKNAYIVHDRGFFVGNHPFDLTDPIEHFHSVLNQVCRR